MGVEALWLLGAGVTLAVVALLGLIPKSNIGAFHAGSRKRASRVPPSNPAPRGIGDDGDRPTDHAAGQSPT
ncbi:hypothetical protein CCAX7_001850 [Capsulimonas corticalis]|uniref:Uncharacterized protein n=1 Tax=Capsulimonas corticalis TaxID=2219043 RepID=A0A402CRU5_9BACT|nr:hypothetical protein [Capsulimonas corticalis]BDI28134.1 hypothetical protein CCAX7_001850 [Capsulimonas corticalis]